MKRQVRNERGYLIGEGHHRAKLSEIEITQLIAAREQGMLFRELANQFNVSETTAKDVCSGRRRAQLAATGPVAVPRPRADGEVVVWSWEPLQRAWSGP